MKKNQINFLCLLIILTLAGSVAMPLYYTGYFFGAGIAHGYQDAREGHGFTPDYSLDMAFNPTFESLECPSDTIVVSDGTRLPLTVTRGYISLPDAEVPLSMTISQAICSIGQIVLFILMLWQFVHFVININKGHIFMRENVKRLTRFGIYLLTIAALECINGLVADSCLSSIGLDIAGYSLSSFWEIPWTNIIIGLMALLMSRIWAKAIAMREENELTI